MVPLENESIKAWITWPWTFKYQLPASCGSLPLASVDGLSQPGARVSWLAPFTPVYKHSSQNWPASLSQMSFRWWQHCPPVNISDATIHFQNSSHTNQVNYKIYINEVYQTNRGGKSDQNLPVLSQMLVISSSTLPPWIFPMLVYFSKVYPYKSNQMPA